MQIIGLVIGLGIIYASTRNWRKSINAVFIIIVFEGVLRKWIIPQASDLIYFLKDIVLLCAYWKYFFASSHEIKYRITNSWLNLLIFFAFFIGIFQTLNPSLGSPIIGLLGLRAYFIYVPLIWVLPTMFRTEDDLIRFLRWNLLLVIPVGILGFTQYFSPADSWINAYAPGEVDIVAVTRSGSVRITSTFSFINSFQGYLIGVFALALPLAFIRQNIVWQMITFAELGFIIGCSFMTGSRTPIYTEAIVGVGYFISLFLTQPASFVKAINNLLVPIAIATPLIIKVFDKAIETFTDRARTAKDTSQRVERVYGEPLAYSNIREGSGYGIGATHPGAGAIQGKLGITAEKVIQANEAEPGKVMLELGPFGFVVWYGLRICFIFTLGLRYFQLQKPFLKSLTLTAFMTHLISIQGQVVFHHVFGLYYWLMASFIFVCPQIELWENYWLQQESEEIFIGNQKIDLENEELLFNNNEQLDQDPLNPYF